jgi:hypothetical protein
MTREQFELWVEANILYWRDPETVYVDQVRALYDQLEEANERLALWRRRNDK